jgi:hypothetical protein
MRIFNWAIGILLLAAAFSSCKKQEVETLYEVNQEAVEGDNLDKFKTKSAKQYISILFTDLHKKGIPINRVVQTERVIQSFGDKSLVNEIIISNYMNSPDVVLPSDSFMRNNLDEFIMDTYRKFYLRIPSEMEKTFFRNFIESNPNVTVELVYTAFASSDEYLFY